MRSQLIPASALFFLTSFAHAAESVTIAQLDQLLSADRYLSDTRVSSLLAAFNLTERVTAQRLDTWRAQFPGPHTQEMLLLLADESAFQPLPVSDISDPPPGYSAEAKIFNAALESASRTSHNLPNLLAIRQTLHFQTSLDVVSELAHAAPDSSSGFVGADILPQFFTGKSSSLVNYRDGKEVLADQVPASSNLGLTTSGEFGAFLTTVLSDAKHGSVVWGYWQKYGDTCLAVFRYQVPAERSHYLVEYREDGATQIHPAYHGEINVDPRTGSILRITMVSDPVMPFEPAIGILVEYGPVILGSRAYIVPLHTAALSKVPIRIGSTALIPVQIFLNDITFTHYRLFRAEARILDAEESKHFRDYAPQ